MDRIARSLLEPSGDSCRRTAYVPLQSARSFSRPSLALASTHRVQERHECSGEVTDSAAIARQLDRVEALTRGMDAQHERLARLKPIVAGKRAELDETVKGRREQGFEAARAIVITNAGRAVMDSARALVDEANRDGAALFRQRQQLRTEARRETMQALLAAGVLGAALCAGLLYGFRRNVLRDADSRAEISAQKELFRATRQSCAARVARRDDRGSRQSHAADRARRHRATDRVPRNARPRAA
jgi:hypothetical protein